MDPVPAQVSVTVSRSSGSPRICVAGEIDQLGAAVLRDALDRVAAEHPGRVDVDLADVTFFDCAGVSALLAAEQAAGGRLVLVAAAPAVRKVLRVLNLAAMFDPTPP